MARKQDNNRLGDWQDKYQKCLSAYSERDKIKEREELYNGSHTVGMANKSATSAWNICAELVESQTDNTIPRPKVSHVLTDERHQKLARVITDMIDNEMERLPSESLNDLDERMCKIDGGTVSLVEWDTTISTHDTVGDISVRLLTAMQFVPQISVYDTRHMDYMFVTFDDTKERIKKRYGKDVENENIDPQTSTADAQSDDIVTQVVCYYKNKKGGLGCFSWAGDTVLIDDENYEARKNKICSQCGKVQADGEKVCVCGNKEWVSNNKEYEYLTEDIVRSDGSVIPAMSSAKDESGEYTYEEYETQAFELDPVSGDLLPAMDYVFDERGIPQTDETGQPVVEPRMERKRRVKMEPTKIPYYYPKMYPVSIRKNISKCESVLGVSDIDVIKDHQIAINRLLTKDDEILLKAARIVPYMQGHPIHLTDNTYQLVEFEAAALQAARSLDLSVDNSRVVAEIQSRYYMAKSVLGITDSFQGKADSTATSGRAKEAQITQAAGRQRSKQVMKNAAASEKYEMFFKYMLAYSDEPRNYVTQDINGQKVQSVFNRYDFLEQDEYGNWYYDDRYLFGVDESGVDTNNKQFMLEDLRTDFGLGAYGDRNDPETILSYWKEKQVIGYPNAARKAEEWTQRVAEYKQQVQMQQQMQQQMQVPIENGIPTQDVMTQEAAAI